MLKRWPEAEEFFEICATAPGSVPAAIQMEALKKMRLVQLIAKGKASPLPKYTNQLLQRQFKGTPYHQFATNYPNNVEILKEIINKERSLFSSEKNLGLLRQALDRAPRWALKKLTATYLSLNLADIGKAVKIDSEEEVRRLLLDMVCLTASTYSSDAHHAPDRIRRHLSLNRRRRQRDLLGPYTPVHACPGRRSASERAGPERATRVP